MAVSLDKKLDLIRKANATLKKEKISNLLAQASKMDSYSAENQQKIKSNVDLLYNQIAEAYKKKQEAVSNTSKPASKNRKKPKKEDTMMGYASMVMKRDNVSWKEALKKSKDHFASIRSKKQDEEQKALDDFKKKVGDVEFERATKYKTKKGTKGTDIERDKVRPALPSGKRIVRTKGQTTNQYGTFKNKIGKVYYEKRANRMDVNQPSKSVYPKLADGGSLGNIGNPFSFDVKAKNKNGENINTIKVVYSSNEKMAKQKLFDFLTQKLKYTDVELTNGRKGHYPYAKGGEIKGFDNLAKKVARSYKGKRVKAKYQDEYGKTYDSKEAMEVGKKVASKVYRLQLAKKKMAKGGEVENITPSLNMEVSQRAKEIYTKKNGKTKSDWDKAMDEAIIEFGFKPSKYHAKMLSIGAEYDDGEYAKGGKISEGNYDMAKNQAKELCHHANELHSVLKKEKHIEAWVISKLERATSDLSDVTHYLDGLSEQHKD